MWITQGVGQFSEDDPEDGAVVVELAPESEDVFVPVDVPESF